MWGVTLAKETPFFIRDGDLRKRPMAVSSVKPGHLAAAQGVEVGDALIKIDNKPVEDKALEHVVSLLKGAFKITFERRKMRCTLLASNESAVLPYQRLSGSNGKIKRLNLGTFSQPDKDFCFSIR